MPRKPTPSMLDQSLPPIPDEELITPEPAVEISEPVEEAPAPAVKKKAAKIKKDVDSTVEAVAEKLDASPAEATVESVVLAAENLPEAAAEEAVPVEGAEPAPEPQHGLVDTLVLAGIGALTLALDEGPKLFHMLVQRGEQAQSKGAVRIPRIRIHLKKSSKAVEAEAEAEPEAPVEEAAVEPDVENPEEVEENDDVGSVIHGPVITLNLFSFGSPVTILPKRKNPPK
jgi:hypothetical protein